MRCGGLEVTSHPEVHPGPAWVGLGIFSPGSQLPGAQKIAKLCHSGWGQGHPATFPGVGENEQRRGGGYQLRAEVHREGLSVKKVEQAGVRNASGPADQALSVTATHFSCCRQKQLQERWKWPDCVPENFYLRTQKLPACLPFPTSFSPSFPSSRPPSLPVQARSGTKDLTCARQVWYH